MPGPKPTFCPKFPEEFLQEARCVVRQKTAPYRSVQRFQLALLLYENPYMEHQEAGLYVGLSADQVRRWRKRWCSGSFSVADMEGRGRKADFSPLEHAVIKATACELIAETKQPLSRQSLADVTTRVQKALHKPISRSTVWQILHKDAIKPWRYKYWIFPRDAKFAEKAGPILDLYAGHWQGKPLGNKDYILSADEKTSIQARSRCHSPLPPVPGRPAYIENEYERGGALQYLAAWDVRSGYVMGRCEPSTGIEPFGRLVKQVLSQEPYCSAERLFWVVDNGSSHRGEASLQRIKKIDARIILLHTPTHASWLNQVEIYFSIIQRKVLTPNDFDSLLDVAIRLALYEELSNQTPAPFKWKFDRTKLTALLAKIEAKQKLISQSVLDPAA